jgi:peptide/nickel transport system permease protein
VTATVDLPPLRDRLGPPPGGAGAVPAATKGRRHLVWRRFRHHRLAVAGVCVLAVIGFAAIVAPLIAPYPLNPTLDSKVLSMARQAPSRHHWFGTDELGRDQLTRILWGARISLVIGLSVALSSTAIGVLVGSVAGWFGGWVDQLLMRANDLLMVIPGLAVLMIAQKGLGGSMTVIIVVLSLLSWYTVARVVRAEFRSLQQLEFVEAARASGASAWRIIRCELLPNTIGIIAVHATLVVGGAILAESALSFLGFGLQPPAVSWGAMLGQSKGAVGTPLAYLVYAPGLAILLTVLAVNFVGNGLRDAFDPRSDT